MAKGSTRYYKVECPQEEDCKIVGNMILFTMKNSGGWVGSDLLYKSGSTRYFSYSPDKFEGDNTVINPEEPVQQFEAKLNESGLKWTTFDLESLLAGVKIK